MNRSRTELSRNITALLDADDRAVRDHRAAGRVPDGAGDMEALYRVLACILTRVARGGDPRVEALYDDTRGDPT